MPEALLRIHLPASTPTTAKKQTQPDGNDDLPLFRAAGQTIIPLNTDLEGDESATCVIALPKGTQFLFVRAKGDFRLDPNNPTTDRFTKKAIPWEQTILHSRNGRIFVDLSRLRRNSLICIYGAHIRTTELFITYTT